MGEVRCGRPEAGSVAGGSGTAAGTETMSAWKTRLAIPPEFGPLMSVPSTCHTFRANVRLRAICSSFNLQALDDGARDRRPAWRRKIVLAITIVKVLGFLRREDRDFRKTAFQQLARQLFWAVIGAPGFAYFGGSVGEFLHRAVRALALGKCEHEFRSLGKRRDQLEDCLHSVFGEVHEHAEAREERRCMNVEAAPGEDLAQRRGLEIGGDELHIRRNRYPTCAQAFDLCPLTRRVIHLKNTQRRGPWRLTITESIEAGAEAHILPNPAPDRITETILRISAAEHDVGAQACG